MNAAGKKLALIGPRPRYHLRNHAAAQQKILFDTRLNTSRTTDWNPRSSMNIYIRKILHLLYEWWKYIQLRQEEETIQGDQ